MARAPLTVDAALTAILAGATRLAAEDAPLADCDGCTLAEPLSARHDQPPFDASAMDGYAVRTADVASLPTTLRVIGEAAAGHPFGKAVGSGEAVRIFTGAPLPAGADGIVIQENTTTGEGIVTVTEGTPDPAHIRPRGGDFANGKAVIAAGTQLRPRHLALAAAMGHGRLPVVRRPRVAILATGDELVEPGIDLKPGQIVASNTFAIQAMVDRAGGEPLPLGIARDDMGDLTRRLDAARDADVLVTIGGASVGDHDLVQSALREAGFTLDFWKIAMRPGKPLMFANRSGQRAIGVPGNPVSSIICTRIFLIPLLCRLLGRDDGQLTTGSARLAAPLAANGPRRHYMRAAVTGSGAEAIVMPAESQDSALLSILAGANALIVREPHAPAAPAGETVAVLPIDF